MNATRWNRLRYTVYTPVYDLIAGIFSLYRQRSINKLALKPNDKLLILGAGTGLDLAYLPANTQITAIDITPSMLALLRKRAEKLELPVKVLVMDGQKLDFEDNTFDAIVLHLILAVIPDPVACLQEAERVLKPGGHIIVFDKFMPDNKQASLPRRVLNYCTDLLATNINRKMGVLLANTNLQALAQEPAALGGIFQIYLLQKNKLRI